MARPVDELFGSVDQPQPKKRAVYIWLTVGLLLQFIGSICTVLPGAALVALAWHLTELDRERLATGYLAKDSKPQIENMRIASVTGIGLTFMALISQTCLLLLGFYDLLWGGLLSWYFSG